MSYTTAANRPNPAAMLGAMGVPAGIGVLLVTGLAITQVIIPPKDNPIATNIEIPKVDELPDLVEPETPASNRETPAAQQDTVITRPESEYDFEFRDSGPISTLPGLGDGLGEAIVPVEVAVPIPSPSPRFDPIVAAPRGNPGQWISDRDYRSSWINRGYSGRAGFVLQVDIQGRVSNCTITLSTGHAALDEATCSLLERRGQFTPARDSSGRAVPGTYSSSVNWRIP
jgi:protein TonB